VAQQRRAGEDGLRKRGERDGHGDDGFHGISFSRERTKEGADR
jgi:hypothetical protein